MGGEDKGRKNGGPGGMEVVDNLGGVTVSLKFHQAAFAFEILVAMRISLGLYRTENIWQHFESH